MKFYYLVRVITLSCIASLSMTAFADSEFRGARGSGQFEFALIADVPYGVAPGQSYPLFDDVVANVNDNHKLKWVLHAGDIKGGGSVCSDEMFYDRLYRYNKFNKPVVLTPGDNEWTDCHRVNAGEFQPLERLAKLREVFYPEPGRTTIGSKSMKVETQAKIPGFEEFPENVMWSNQDVVFAAIHIVGSNNGLRAFDPNSSAVRTQADDDEIARRTNAGLEWLAKTFAKADAMDSPGVFLMIHANPGLERGSVNRTGFEGFLAALENHIIAFEKPVVLAHGDSHYFRVDKPALVNASFLPNFTRVEAFGSSRVHWLRVKVNPKSEEVFTIYQEIIE